MKTTVKKVYLITQLIVLLYSSLRAFLATFVDEFYGSILVLWLIDVGTAVPYVWGGFRFFTGKTQKDRLIGLAVALPAFLAPYIYWYSQGKDYPWMVNLVVVLFIAIAVVSETYKYHKSKSLK